MSDVHVTALERASCCVCDSTDVSILFTSEDRMHPVPGVRFPVGRCRGCGHVYLTQRPSPAEIGGYYADSYRAHVQRDEPSERKGRRHRFIRTRPPFRILDVGCGSGYDLLRLEGCELYGIEPDPGAAEEARRQGIEVTTESIETAPFPDGHFRWITMNYSLEHLFDPRAALANVRRMLRPDGRCYILIPTADGLWFHWFKRDWYHLDVPRHLQFFTHETFRRLCARTGLKIVYRGCRSGGRGFRRSLGRRGEEDPIAHAAHRAIRARPVARLLKFVLRYVVDGMRLGDVAEYVVRPR